MKLIKIKHAPAKYVIISQICIEDQRLSWGAKGLFAYLAGRPPEWEIHFADLLNRGAGGKFKLTKYLKELQAHGYLKIEKIKGAGGKWTGAVWTINDEPENAGLPAQNVAESHSTPYPGFPEAGKTVRGKTVTRKNSIIQYTKNKIKDSKQQQKHNPPAPRPVVVVDDFENDIKTPCLTGHKCNDFSNFETVNKAIEIYKVAANKKTIKNPTGYICGICRKGAYLPPGHETAPERAARAAKAKAAKAAAEAEAQEAAEKDARARTEFLKLPDDVKANYINTIKADMPSNFGFTEAVICAMAAAKWAEEANYA